MSFSIIDTVILPINFTDSFYKGVKTEWSEEMELLIFTGQHEVTIVLSITLNYKACKNIITRGGGGGGAGRAIALPRFCLG